jgi:hypothetical protein
MMARNEKGRLQVIKKSFPKKKAERIKSLFRQAI